MPMIAIMQEPHWGLGKFQEFAPSDRQQYMQRPMTNTVYAYQYGVQSGAHETPMPMYYEHDHHHHSAQHVNPMWAHQLQPYPAMSAEQVMSQMPMNVYGPTSIPQSPVAWPQSPQFWQSSHGPQHQSRHITPISPQHGPPRRPIQSRHALWVGNIPSHTPILALRDHFLTQEFANDVLSIVFTPSSNSGFINFRSAEACKLSMRRHNKSFLYGVPLNCRARKASLGPASNASESKLDLEPQPSTASNSSISEIGSEDRSLCKSPLTSVSSVADSDLKCHETSETLPQEISTKLKNVPPRKPHNRYFIIKSLTYDDLLNSVKSRRWSTQIQNEGVLDDAFQAGDFVYLIFSVNRSREYFGYARMTSRTELDVAPVVASTPPNHSSQNLPQLSKPPIIRTPTLGFIPAGRIIDELCRGKIFWEIDEVDHSPNDINDTVTSQPEGLPKSFGIDWLSLKRIPFRQTTNLKNQLNENKEVKIARDGTELDSEVGRRLCSLFHVPN